MAGTNPVGTWEQDPDFQTQLGTAYKTALDNALAVLRRVGRSFAPHEQATPNMTVRLDEGFTWDGTTLTEVAAQSTGTITAPSGNPRIDRVVVDEVTGAVSVITGTEAASPTPPAVTAGKIPVAQVLLQTTTTAITNQEITDERTAIGTQPAFAAGTRIVFDQDAAPTGWTKDTSTVNDRVIRIVTGSRADGGSWTVSGLTVASHAHTLLDGSADASVGDASAQIYKTGAGTLIAGGATGATLNRAQQTTDSLSPGVNSSGAWRPLHRDMIICSKD